MTISDKGTLASFIRDGDYISFTADKSGTAVQYSPTAAPGAAVIGAFAARNGKVKYYSAPEAAELLQNESVGAEKALVHSIEGMPEPKVTPTSTKIFNALVAYATSGYDIDPVWDGRLADFHREVIYPATGLRQDGRLIRAVKKLATMTPAFEVAKIDREYYVRVDWAKLEAGES